MVDDAHGLASSAPKAPAGRERSESDQQPGSVLMGTLGKRSASPARSLPAAPLIDGSCSSRARTSIRPRCRRRWRPPLGRDRHCARFEDWRRDKSQRLVAHFGMARASAASRLLDSRTPIQPVVIGASNGRWSRAVARAQGSSCRRSGRRPSPGEGALARRAVGAALRNPTSSNCSALARAIGHARTEQLDIAYRLVRQADPT
jgi:8-amino-7-oxononanoate synthase